MCKHIIYIIAFNKFIQLRHIAAVVLKGLGSTFDWHRCVKSPNALMNALIRVCSLVQGKVTRSTVLASISILRTCYRLGRRQGQGGLARYLKACSIYVMRYVAGDALHNSFEFKTSVSLTRGGIPRVFPPVWREAIRRGDMKIIKLTLTVCGLYRVLDFKGELKLSTITSPGTFVISKELEAFLPRFTKAFLPVFDRSLFKWDPIPLLSKGAHVHNAVFSVKVPFPKKKGWTSQGALASAIAAVNSHLPDLKEIANLLGLEPEYQAVIGLRMVLGDVVWKTTLKFWGDYNIQDGELPVLRTLSAPSGRLAVKEEPGKMRVFAMVDAFTQWFLYPLHRRIFTWLKTIETDATFDQRAAVVRASTLIGDQTKVWSYDLSAATDRLPALLQAKLLNSWCLGLGDAWQRLLVDRPYSLPRQACRGLNASVRYAVGQPMGAYSSWAMLAMTHHMIVQFAAFRSCVTSGGTWFKDYAVLGDDVIIWNERVAKVYLSVMKELGVEISPSKSLSSPKGVFEFAKRFVVAGQDCSAVPLQAVAASSSNLAVFAELLRTLPTLSISVLMRFLGFGYKVLGGLSVIPFKLTRRAFAAFWAMQPGLCLQSVDKWSSWFVTTGPRGNNIEPSWFDVIARVGEFLLNSRPKRPAEVPFFFSLAFMPELIGSEGSKDSLFPSVPFGKINEVEALLASLFHGHYSELFVRGCQKVREFDTLVEQTGIPIGPHGIDLVMEVFGHPVPTSVLLSTGAEQSLAWREFSDPDKQVISVSKWIRLRLHLRKALR